MAGRLGVGAAEDGGMATRCLPHLRRQGLLSHEVRLLIMPDPDQRRAEILNNESPKHIPFIPASLKPAQTTACPPSGSVSPDIHQLLTRASTVKLYDAGWSSDVLIFNRRRKEANKGGQGRYPQARAG